MTYQLFANFNSGTQAEGLKILGTQGSKDASMVRPTLTVGEVTFLLYSSWKITTDHKVDEMIVTGLRISQGSFAVARKFEDGGNNQ